MPGPHVLLQVSARARTSTLEAARVSLWTSWNEKLRKPPQGSSGWHCGHEPRRQRLRLVELIDNETAVSGQRAKLPQGEPAAPASTGDIYP